MAKETIEIYLLDVRAPKLDSKRIEIKSVLTVGSDSGCDIVLKECGLSPLHGRFRLQNDVLTFTNLGLDDSCKIGSQKCGQGRMYILDKGDKFSTGDVKIIVRREKKVIEEKEVKKVEASNPQQESAQELQDDSTDPSAPLGAYEEENLEEEYEEVEVYVDEDGNEVAPPKKLGFFGRLKLKRQQKKQEKKRAKELKKTPPKGLDRGIAKPPLLKKGKLRPPTAGIISRFFGLVFDLFTFFYVFNLGLPLLKEKLDIDIIAHITPLVDSLYPAIEKALTKISSIPELTKLLADNPQVSEMILDKSILTHVLAFLGYDILFHLILGVGLGSFLIGLKPHGSFIIIRLLSPIRVILGWLALPLLILDFPVLFKKATFKELITGTRILNRSLAFNLFSAFLFVPAAVLAIGNMNLLPLLLKLPNPVAHIEITAKKNKGSFKEAPFNLRSYGYRKEGKTFLHPKVELIPTLPDEKIARYAPLILLEPNKNQRVTLHNQRVVMTYQEIFSILKKDPTFSMRRRDLINAITQNTDKKSKTIKNLDQAQILIESLYEIFALDFKDPIRGVRVLGPFVGPYFELKNIVLKKLGLLELSKVMLIEGNRAKYIKIFPKKKTTSNYLLSVSKEGLSALRIRIKEKSHKFAQKVIERIFVYPRELKKKYSSLMRELKKDEEGFNKGFMAHAILTRACEKQALKPSEVQFFINYFMTISQKAIKTENEVLQSLLLNALEPMDKALLKLKKRNKDAALGKLRLGVLSIQKALLKRDMKFFKANTK